MENKGLAEFVLWYMKKHEHEKSAEKFAKARGVVVSETLERKKFEKIENRILGKTNEEKKVTKKMFTLDVDLSGPSATRRIDENVKLKSGTKKSKIKVENKDKKESL